MKMMLPVAVLVLLAFMMPRQMSAKPTPSTSEDALATHPPMTDDQRINYLIRFGHLKIGANQMSDMDVLRKSISNLQRFAGIPVTGEMDEATDALMATPRCGLPDDLDEATSRRRKRFVVQGKKWPRQKLTYLFQNYTSKLETDVTRKVVATAFQFWTAVTPLGISEAPSTAKSADIKIRFARGYHGDSSPFDGKGGVLGHAYFPTSGATHFDEDEAWTNGVNSGVNFLQVATHELGHALGLSHSNVSGSVMAPFYKAYDPKFTLTKDDIDGIQSIYVSPLSGTLSTKSPVSSTSGNTPVARDSPTSRVSVANRSTTIATKNTTTPNATTTKTTPIFSTTSTSVTSKATSTKTSLAFTNTTTSQNTTTTPTTTTTRTPKAISTKTSPSSTTITTTSSLSSTSKSTSISNTSTTSTTFPTTNTTSTVVPTRTSTRPVLERETLPSTRPSVSSISTEPASTRTTTTLLPSSTTTTISTSSARTPCSWFGRIFGWC